jgi:hypothetical protein
LKFVISGNPFESVRVPGIARNALCASDPATSGNAQQASLAPIVIFDDLALSDDGYDAHMGLLSARYNPSYYHGASVMQYWTMI